MNTDIATKFTDKCSWQFSKIHSKSRESWKVREKRHNIKETRTLSPYITSAYSHHIPSLLSQIYTDKDRDKYQHIITYSDGKIIKHSYLNTEVGVGVQPATSQHVIFHYNLLIHHRKWHFHIAKSSRLTALVTMRITTGANAWR